MSVQIGSGGRYLRLTARGQLPHPEHLLVELDTAGLTASCVIIETPLTGSHGLAEFFELLADNWRGWVGNRSWTSLEGDLHLAATHTGRRIEIVVILRQDLTREFDGSWHLEAGLSVDPGEDLARVARDVRGLVAPGW